MLISGLRKNALNLMVFLFCIVLLYIRCQQPSAGIYAVLYQSDFTTHVSISSHVKNVNFFPYLNLDHIGEHGVSKFLPIYHGMILFPLTAAVLEYLGLPMPGAYQFIMELSVLLSIFFIFNFITLFKPNFINLSIIICLIIFVLLPNFAKAITLGFYSQTFAVMFLLAAYYYYLKLNTKVCFTLLVCAAWCSPDFLLWLIPGFVVKNNSLNSIIKGILCLGWVVLTIVFFRRLSLYGPSSYNINSIFILLFVFTLNYKSIQHQAQRLTYTIACFLIISIFFMTMRFNNFDFSYYAVKLTCPAILFLIYIFLIMKLQKKMQYLSLFSFIFFGISPNFSSDLKTVYEYFTPTTITNQAYKKKMEILRTYEKIEFRCKNQDTISFLADKEFTANERKTAVILNALLTNYDLTTLNFKNDRFSMAFRKARLRDEQFKYFLTIGKDEKELINLLIPQLDNNINSDLCFIIPQDWIFMFSKTRHIKIIGNYRDTAFIKL